MPDTSHVRIGPLHLSNTQFFAALAVLILAALEYRRLVLLDIPLQANLGSFDVLTAALANGSIFALVLAVLFLLLGIVVLIGLGLAAVLYACWLYLFAIATLARFGLFQTLRAMTQLDFYRYLRIEPPDDPNLIQRTARKAFPSLDNQTKLARAYCEKQGGTLRPYLVRRMEWLRNAVEVVKSPFVDWKGAPAGIRRTVAASFVALVCCTFPIQSISISALKQDMLERSALADAGASRFESLRFRWDAATLGTLLRNPRQMVRVLTSPPIPQGTLQIRNLSRQPTHLKLACGTRDGGIRTERVFLVAEMGDWMHLAPWTDPEKRLMIRRSEVSEFQAISRPGDIARNPEPCLAQADPDMAKIEAMQDQVDRLQDRITRAVTAGFHRRPTADRVSELEGELASLRDRTGQDHSRLVDEIGRTEKALQDTTRHLGALEDRLDDLGRGHADLSSKTADRHLAFEQRLATHEIAQARLETARNALRKDLFRTRIELGQLARRLDLHSDKSVAVQDRMRPLADDIARIEDRVIGPDGAETSGDSLAGEFLAGIVRLLPDLLGESLAFPIALSGLAENAEFGEFLEYGFPMRVSGVLSDVLRDSGNPELRSCLANLSDPVAVIDFPEGRTRFTPGLGPLRDLVDLKRREAGPAVILMRGGASYTGDATKNLRLSEQRAEWVKGQFLRMLFDDRSTLPVELDRLARREHDLQVLAFGIGERFTRRTTHSARAVEIFVCPNPETQEQTAGIRN